MKRRQRQQTLMTEINITPFTDVILVLLIIFIIATPLISQSRIEIKLPETSSENTMDDTKQFFIIVSSEGVIYFDNKVLTTEELQKKIKSLLAKDANSKFIVAADKSCRFKDVVKVIDLLQESGAKTLNIATKPEK